MSRMPDRDTSIGFKLLHLVATVTDACDQRPGYGLAAYPRNHPGVGTPRRFPREGTPWRGLIATEEHASRADRGHRQAALRFRRSLMDRLVDPASLSRRVLETMPVSTAGILLG
jgi:hypothetical protein